LIAVNARPALPCFLPREGEKAMFKSNVGSVDRMLRILVGVILIALVFVGPQTPWGWLGLIPLVTGLFSTCPIYSFFGLNTCRRV
jgi:Protein of unknown function (DUF2892)